MKLAITLLAIATLTSCNITTNPDGSTDARLDSKTALGLAKILSEK